MEIKTARLTLLVDPNKKAAFERLCAQQDRTPSQVVRQLIRDYLAAHGVGYVASGLAPSEPQPADEIASSRTKTHSKRTASARPKRPTAHRKG